MALFPTSAFREEQIADFTNRHFGDGKTTTTIPVTPSRVIGLLERAFQEELRAAFGVDSFPDRDDIVEAVKGDPAFTEAYQRMGESSSIDPILRWLKALLALASFSPAMAMIAEGDQQHKASAEQAVVRAWGGEYKGRMAFLLFKVCTFWMNHKRDSHYANVVPYIQSSGTGKSRTVKELCHHCVMVEASIAPKLNSGGVYPPPDISVRDLFEDALLSLSKRDMSDDDKKNTIQGFMQGFIYGLVDELEETLKHMHNEQHISSFAELSAAFSKRMNDGGTYSQHSEFRIKFWGNAVQRARKFTESLGTLDLITGKSPHLDAEKHTGFIARVKKLTDWLQSIKKVDPNSYPMKPVAIFGIDEAHSFLRVHMAGFSLNSEFRRAMRHLKDLPISSVLLATGGAVAELTPPVRYDVSARIRENVLLPTVPFPLVLFDALAKITQNSSSLRLENLAATSNLAHLGRALFGALFDAGDQDCQQGIVLFARDKLLSAEPLQTGTPMEMATQKLAALAPVLGLKFTFGRFDPRIAAEQRLVEQHMRIVLSMTPKNHDVGTISPSEPLIAEAAFSAVHANPQRPWNLPEALLDHTASSAVSLGDRGEIIGALLIILAIYKARGPPGQLSGDLTSDGLSRTVTVVEFLKALLPTGAIGEVLKLRPVNGDASSAALDESFSDARIWVNHFLHADDSKALSQRCLWACLCRGAAIICPVGQCAIDIIFPVLIGSEACPENVVPAVVQIKNIEAGAHVKASLFDGMNPFTLGILDKKELEAQDRETPVPVLRMVFSLGVEGGWVEKRDPPERRSSRVSTKPVAHFYDVWVAGTSRESFGVIGSSDEETFRKLLGRSLPRGAPYDLDADELSSMPEWGDIHFARRMMNPGAGANPATKNAHFERYVNFERAPVSNPTSSTSMDVDAPSNNVAHAAGEDTLEPQHATQGLGLRTVEGAAIPSAMRAPAPDDGDSVMGV
ncbi:hypothetical protein PENSPDRAFT_602048 [Peniophora sp. CONT]|nr:hypothetical protein PENSPDRAFT_602048 [Peniophora sp. CONT]